MSSRGLFRRWLMVLRWATAGLHQTAPDLGLTMDSMQPHQPAALSQWANLFGCDQQKNRPGISVSPNLTTEFTACILRCCCCCCCSAAAGGSLTLQTYNYDST